MKDTELLDAGEIDYSRPNSSRRVPLDQVLAYRERRSRKRRQIPAEMTAEAVDMGLYPRPHQIDLAMTLDYAVDCGARR